MIQPSGKEVKQSSNLKSLLIPGLFVGYSFYALHNEELVEFDNSLKEEIWTEHPHKQIKVDNYLQYAPAMAVYGLNALGIKGKNNLRDLSMIYLLSNAMMGATVYSIKKIPYRSIGINFMYKFGKIKIRQKEDDNLITF